MPQDSRTHYQVLGVDRDAKLPDIERAWRRFRSEMQQEAAAPDPRRALLMQKAYEVLSDPARREAYDESLRSAAALLARARTAGNRKVAAAGLAVAAVAAIGYFALRPEAAAEKERDPREIAEAVSLAVGRVEGIDLSGTRSTLGLAFALGEGSLAASCKGLSPTSQIVVTFAQRAVPARVATVFGPDVCRLSAHGMGSWPLAIAPGVPRSGQKVYAAKVGTKGEVALVEGAVRSVHGEDGVTVIGVTGPASLQPVGAPLLDAQGRVLGVCAGAGRYLQVPHEWIAEIRGPKPVERPIAEPTPAPEPKLDPIDEEAHRRAQALKVPDDI
ncbi:MAG TPA: DnaJ domain-containing protein [Usitatibacter sp.]|nr:DnaJ domain-containing protein [Usitatibacter sp.]